VTYRVALIHTSDTQEAWDFCRGVASYRPNSGVWGLCSIPMKSHSSPAYLTKLGQTVCDGAIMLPGRRQTLDVLHRRGVKVVDVGGESEAGRAPYPRIRLDDAHIGRLVGEHLLQRGFTRVIYLGEGSDWSRNRANALQQVIKHAGGECRVVVAAHWGYLLSESWIIKQLTPMPRPFAVMGCDDVVAGRVVRAVNAAGWHIPSEIGVIGVDDRITECIGVQPPLSSVGNERFRIGHEAARLLDDLFLGKPPSTQIHWIRPQNVTERESTSTFVCDDADVSLAMAYIHREACNGIAIDDVIRKVNLSRRTFERRFVQVVGRPPGEEIRRVRIEAVKRAILRDDLPLADVAPRCGYSCLSALSHAFRLATGMSPQQYRHKQRARYEIR
jgi:LacI family transcriptional regulator